MSVDVRPAGARSCAEIASCARAWPPAYTDGSPGYSGVPGGNGNGIKAVGGTFSLVVNP
jgi:hypothetical protein